MEEISSDIVGPYQLKSQLGKPSYIVTFTDLCTRFTKIKFINDLKSKSVINALKNTWIKAVNRTPASIRPDQGTQYTSTIFREFCESNKIKHKLCMTNNPTANAKSERINKAINEIIRMYNNKLSKKKLAEIIENKLNRTQHSVTAATPHALVFKEDAITGKKIDDLTHNRMIDEANKNSALQTLKNTRRENTRRKNHKYKINDLVYVKNRTATKLDPIWSGPFRITEIGKYIITLSKPNCNQKVSIRNIRPSFIRGADCHTLSDDCSDHYQSTSTATAKLETKPLSRAE